jgi:hypothetical protein
MKAGFVFEVAAWTVLVLLVPLAAFDILIVLGGLFTMSNADCAIADNWIWFGSGPFSFLPGLGLGIISALIFRIPFLRRVREQGRSVIWMPILWLAAGALLFAWVQLWGVGLSRELNSKVYIFLISVPMLIAALCLWVVRTKRPDECSARPAVADIEMNR